MDYLSASTECLLCLFLLGTILKSFFLSQQVACVEWLISLLNPPGMTEITPCGRESKTQQLMVDHFCYC